MKVLVTGGAGYIGSHVVKELLLRGHVPIILDRAPPPDALKDVKYWPADVAYYYKDVPFMKCDAVIHLAALAYVGESIEYPLQYYMNNVQGLINVIRKTETERFVFSSSCAVYGQPEKMPVNEATPFAPMSPYGRTKVMGEEIILDVAKADGFSTAILRYFNVAGADPDGVLRESPDSSRLIPNVIRAAYSGQVLKINGEDHPTRDGTAMRDYVHVTDLARAHVAALEHPENLVLNLGAGQAFTILEVIQEVEAQTGKKVNWDVSPRIEDEPSILVADVSLAQTTIGYEPEHSSLETIIRTALPHFSPPR